MQKNNMSQEERKFIKALIGEQPSLEFPLKPLLLSNGFESQEYEIPKDKRQEVYDELYPFTDGITMDDVALDIHSGKKFYVRDYRLIREDGINFLASPYYPESGGTVLDWAKIPITSPVVVTVKRIKHKKQS